VKVLSRVFRGKFVAGLKTAFHHDKLEFYGYLAPLAEPRTFAAWLRSLFRHDWVVYAKPPFGGPEHALRYLSGYTHRIAISNRRLVALEQGNVTFRWRDSAHANKQRLLTLPVDEFLRRFLLPPAATRLHAHPQLRLPRQPATRFAAAALLPVARRFSRYLCSNCAARCGSSLLVHLLELSRLRRLHARRGTALCGSTVAAFSTPHPLICRMSPQLQPRSLHMLPPCTLPLCLIETIAQQNHLYDHRQLPQDYAYRR
jgi:hypothetical protein